MDALTMGQINREDPLRNNESFPTVGRFGGEFLPYMHFDPVVTNIADRDEYIRQCLPNLMSGNVPRRSLDRLKNAVIDNLSDIPNIEGEAYVWMREALSSQNGVATQVLANILKQKHGLNLIPSNFQYSITNSGQSGYAATSNFKEIFQLSESEEHKVFEATVLGVGGFYQRLGMMKGYEAIAWFSDADSQVLDAEMKIAADLVNSRNEEARMLRILELRELPALGPDSLVSADALMNLRNSTECRQFREWLKTSDNKSDDEIREELRSFRVAFSNFLNATSTRVARFVLNNAVSAHAPGGGIVLDGAQQFVLDKIFPANGPVSFINNKLPPLWKNDPWRI